MSDGDPAQALRRLTEWLETGGARFPSLHLRTDGDGERGGYAGAPIRKGESVLAVPLRLILTGQTAWVSAIGRRIEASGLAREDSHTYLAAYLLQERHTADSFWSTFIEVLPASFSHVPLFFGPEDLALLEGSCVLEKIAGRRSALEEEYQDLCRAVPGFERFSPAEFLWAQVTVGSRCFGMTIYGRESYGLVPMADMLNHKHPRETAWSYDDGTHRFVITALQDFAPGDPLCYSYGRKCNSELFLLYGFCLTENEDNRARIRFGHPLPRRTFQVSASFAHQETREMLSFLRLACTTEGEEPPPGSGEETGPISLPNETRSLLALAEACRESLRRFPAGLEEDEALLEDRALTRNRRNAILMRRGEKRVLRDLLALAEAAVPWLCRPWSELERAVAEHRCAAGPLDDYLAAVAASLRPASLGA